MSLNTISNSGTHMVQSEGVRVPLSPPTKMTKLAFKQRMTASERIAIRTAAATNPVVFDFMDLVDSATYVDLSRADTQQGVAYLESEALIGVGRADEVINTPITDEEAFQ